jgi:spermidine synthase
VSPELPQLFTLESPFPAPNSLLHFLEPQDTCSYTLWSRVFDGTYDKPFILDTGKLRYLHFDFSATQSAMFRDDPYRLTLAYTRKMMAFLLFQGSPHRILVLGLGGGSLAKFCYQRLPHAAITAVEVNPDVIALRDAFLIPKDDERFRVIHANSARYIARRGPGKDVILADACTRDGIAPDLDAIEFYQGAWRRLCPGGVFVMNLCGARSLFPSHLAKIHHVFGDFITLPVRREGNVIVFAFKRQQISIDWGQLQNRALRLKRRFGLEFPRHVRRIALEWRLRQQRARPRRLQS